MRLIETVRPNTAYRVYSVDSRLTDTRYVYSQKSAYEVDERMGKFYKELLSIPLVKDVSILPYEIGISVVEAFASESYTWECVQSGVSNAIKTHYQLPIDFTSYEEKMLNEKVKKDEDDEKRIAELGKIFSSHLREGLTISPDFRKHRWAWREAIIRQVRLANELNEGLVYWQHELEVFDKAFSALFALNLPEK